MNIDRACAVYSLKFASTLTSGMFAGGAMYINMVESPARLTHDGETAVTIWKPSFLRAQYCMSKLTITSGFCSLLAYWLSEDRHPTKWLLAGGLMLTIPPYTIFFICPTNNELIETEKCIENGNSWIEDKLSLWNTRHAVRSAISLSAFGYMLWLLSNHK